METKSFCDPIFKNIPCVIAIGVFDGMHPGHIAIVDETVKVARESGSKSVVITFSVNPKMAKGAMQNLGALQSTRDLTEILTIRGIDYHCVIDFSDDMSKLSGEEFIALLCTSYDVKAMVVGDSFRAGNPSHCVGPAQIEKLLLGYTSSAFLRVVPSVVKDGQVVSSSLIRRCLLTGDLVKAASLLGRAYSLDLRDAGTSQKRLFDVRTLGLLLPKEGEYMVEATADGKSVKAKAVVSESCLALELPVRMNPDRITFLGE
ncbi:MAG: FAD synthetase [Spirochaetales bacterium]